MYTTPDERWRGSGRVRRVSGPSSGATGAERTRPLEPVAAYRMVEEDGCAETVVEADSITRRVGGDAMVGRGGASAIRIWLVVAVTGGALVGVAGRVLAQDNYSGNCSFSASGGIYVITGDEYSNNCYGGLSPDSFFMKGAADTTHGRGANDQHRGATGDDYLGDTQTGDSDTFCDGDGSDQINMQDSDSNDTWYRIGDGDNDQPAIKDSNDTINAGWTACPM